MELTLSPAADPIDAPDSLMLSDDMLYQIDGNGEVIGIHNAPDNAAKIEEIIDFIGPRKIAIEAKLVALRTQKAAYYAVIDAYFEPLIKAQESALKWLTGQYYNTLEAYTRAVVPTLKRSKSFKVGWLTLSLRKDSASTDILRKDAALAWAKAECPEAVKVEEKVLVSLIPDEIKAGLTPDRADVTGIVFVPAGEDRFEVK